MLNDRFYYLLYLHKDCLDLMVIKVNLEIINILYSNLQIKLYSRDLINITFNLLVLILNMILIIKISHLNFNFSYLLIFLVIEEIKSFLALHWILLFITLFISILNRMLPDLNKRHLVSKIMDKYLLLIS